MRKIREVLRLRLEADLSVRQISSCTKASVGSCVLPRRPIPPYRLAISCPIGPLSIRSSSARGVSKQLLWEEYTQRYPNSCYRYSQFCDRYKSWCQLQKRPMRQIHKAEEKLFID